MGSIGFGVPELLIVVMGSLSLAWYVGVILLLFKIWRKVRHLPG